jgi:hypothetical protein
MIAPPKGARCKVSGEPGDFLFVEERVSSKGAVSWMMFEELTKQMRAFRPEKVKVQK